MTDILRVVCPDGHRLIDVGPGRSGAVLVTVYRRKREPITTPLASTPGPPVVVWCRCSATEIDEGALARAWLSGRRGRVTPDRLSAVRAAE